MHLRSILFLCTITALFSGCSSIKSLLGENKKQKKQSTVSVVTEDTPKAPVQTDKDQTQDNKLSDNAIPQIKTPEPVLLVVKKRPQVNFSETESANVRIPLRYNDPFSGSGELILPFEELQQDFCYPYKGKLISSFGYRGRSFHSGIDIKAIPNDTIRAAWPGVVRMSKPYSGYGNVIVIRHYNGIETVYSHQAKNLVSVNDVVESGHPIGLAGRTGRATTEHLHFEIRIASEAINPTLFVDPENHCLREEKQLYCYNRGGKIRVSTKASDRSMPSEQDDASARTLIAAAGPSASNSTAKSTTPSTRPTSSSSSNFHYVKKGETLSHIARAYSTTVSKLCALNHLKETSVLQIKQKLRVR